MIQYLLLLHVEYKQHIQWNLNSRSCSFWWDNQLGIGPLAQYSTTSNRSSNTIVAEFQTEGQWNWSKLIELAPASQHSYILATKISQQDLPDQAVWKLSNNGVFSCSSSWEEFTEKRTKNQFNSLLWHKTTHFNLLFYYGEPQKVKSLLTKSQLTLALSKQIVFVVVLIYRGFTVLLMLFP